MSRRYTNIPQPALIDAINTIKAPHGLASIWWMSDFASAEGRYVRASAETVQKLRISIAERKKRD